MDKGYTECLVCRRRLIEYGDRSARTTRWQTNKEATDMPGQMECEMEDKRLWNKNDRMWSKPEHKE